MEQDKPINVAVFIDYENVYKELLQQKTNVLRLAFFEKLRKWCAGNNRRIVSMIVYCNFDNIDLYESYHQSTLQRYGVETVHTSNQGKNYADLKITIDVLTSIYSNNNIDEFFIMSNDKDMTPLLNTIRANKRNVAIITTGENYNHSICEFADKHIKLEEICAIDVEHKIIDDIANEFLEKNSKHLGNQIKDYNTKQKYVHCELKYTLSNELKYLKIMGYELATIIKDIYDRGDIFFYNYDYSSKGGTKECIGIAPTNQKANLIALGLVDEKRIIEKYNVQDDIDRLYSKALS